jgi:hypothetical protein
VGIVFEAGYSNGCVNNIALGLLLSENVCTCTSVMVRVPAEKLMLIGRGNASVSRI